MRLEQKMGSSQFADPNYERLANVQQTGTFLHASHGRYRFNWGDVSLVYRHIDWQFDSSSRLDNMNFSGPLLAAKLRF
jgi:hypothetical protein